MIALFGFEGGLVVTDQLTVGPLTVGPVTVGSSSIENEFQC